MTLHIANVRVLTMDGSRRTAGSVTIASGRIVAVDAPASESVAVVDGRGGVLLPGFIDPHVHLLAAAAARRSVDCSPRSVRSIAELQRRIDEAAAASRDGWIRAVGYDESALAEGRHPTRWDLDAAAADRPVRLQHRSGHAVVLNSLGLAVAGITIASDEPPGGVIDRRITDGEPTGLLIDMDAVIERAVPPLSETELVAGLRTLSDDLVRAGITAVQDMTHRNDHTRLVLLDRVVNAAAFAPHTLPSATRPNIAGNGPVKLMLPEATGPDAAFAARFRHTVASAHQEGRQVAIHTVTHAGFSLALDAIADAFAGAPRPNHRHRIEHASIAPPPLMERTGGLGVVVVSNPIFLYESGRRYRATVPPDQLPHLYAVGTLARSGIVTAAASDAPVVRPSPLLGVHAAMTRRDAEGAILPGDPAGLDDALAMVTRSAAYAAFADDRFGTIAPGLPADLVLLNEMPGGTNLPSVLWTVIGGRPVYVADGAPPFPASGH
ncbi:MAG: amidohydrolase [Dehalococcoidia bacterium]